VLVGVLVLVGSLVLTGSNAWDILDYAANYAGGHKATGLYTPEQAAAFLMLAVGRVLAGYMVVFLSAAAVTMMALRLVNPVRWPSQLAAPVPDLDIRDEAVK
jgi:hypothetical protein